MVIEETVRYEEQSLYKYVDGKVDYITRTVKPYMQEGRDVTAKELKAEQATNRLEGWRGKVMHGQHVRQIEEFTSPESWQWLKRGSLKRETESLLGFLSTSTRMSLSTVKLLSRSSNQSCPLFQIY